MTRSLDGAYRARMIAAQQQFATAVQELLRACGAVQTVFTELVRDIDVRVTELRESDAELKRLILEQGAQIRDLRDRLTDLRDKLAVGEHGLKVDQS